MNFQRYTHTAIGMQAADDGEFVRFDQVKDGLGQQLSITATMLNRLGGALQITIDDLNRMGGKNVEFANSKLNGKLAITLHLVDAERVPDEETGYKS